MLKRIGVALAICFCFTRLAAAQVVRFETTMGDFDVVLNPTHNTLIQGYVDNFLNYVTSDRYLGSWINRDDAGFVLQMGGLFSNTKRPPVTVESTRPVAAFAPVRGVAASSVGLSNTPATVSLALAGGNPNSGTSSFFVNLGDNSGLDAQGFTPFAEIPDMSVINKIVGLSTVDLGANPLFGAGNDDITFGHVPVQADGKGVFVTRAFVVSGTSTVVTGASASQQLAALSASSTSGGLISSSSADLATPLTAPVSGGGVSSGAVPEPTTLTCATALLYAMTAGLRGRRQRRSLRA